MNNAKKKNIGSSLFSTGFVAVIVSYAWAAKIEKDRRSIYMPSKVESTMTSFLTLLIIAGSVCVVVGILLYISAKLGEKNDAMLGKSGQMANTLFPARKCPACGLELSDEADVCPNCGTKVEHTDSLDITQAIKTAEKGGKRTAIAIPVSGDMVSIQEKISKYLQSQGYSKGQNANGESVWVNSSYMIKNDFVPGYMILSGCLSLNGDESNLNGMYGGLAKRAIANHMSEIRKLVE